MTSDEFAVGDVVSLIFQHGVHGLVVFEQGVQLTDVHPDIDVVRVTILHQIDGGEVTGFDGEGARLTEHVAEHVGHAQTGVECHGPAKGGAEHAVGSGMFFNIEQVKFFVRQGQDDLVEPEECAVGAGLFHIAPATATGQECHRDGTDAVICNEIIHNGAEFGAVQIILSVVDDQERDGFFHGRTIQINIALVIVAQPFGLHAVTGQRANGKIPAADGERRGHGLGHVKIVVASAHAVADGPLVERVGKFLLCDGVVEGVFDVRVAG